MRNKNKFYFLITFFVVLDLSLIFFLISPLFAQIKLNSKEIVFQKDNLSSLVKEKQEMIENRDLYNVVFKDLDKINELFINKETPIDFINFLERTAQALKVSIEIAPTFISQESTDFWPSLSFQVKLEGSFPNFLRFINKIENSPYLLEIVNLNFKSQPEKNELKSSAVFTIRVFTK